MEKALLIILLHDSKQIGISKSSVRRSEEADLRGSGGGVASVQTAQPPLPRRPTWTFPCCERRRSEIVDAPVRSLAFRQANGRARLGGEFIKVCFRGLSRLSSI
jgi:hypothetical protein